MHSNSSTGSATVVNVSVIGVACFPADQLALILAVIRTASGHTSLPPLSLCTAGCEMSARHKEATVIERQHTIGSMASKMFLHLYLLRNPGAIWFHQHHLEPVEATNGCKGAVFRRATVPLCY